MLGNNPGSNQNAFNSVIVKPFYSVEPEVNPEPMGLGHNPNFQINSLSHYEARGRVE